MLTETREEGIGFLDPLKLELQVLVNFMMWVLRTKLGTSVRSVHALNC